MSETPQRMPELSIDELRKRAIEEARNRGAEIVDYAFAYGFQAMAIIEPNQTSAPNGCKWARALNGTPDRSGSFPYVAISTERILSSSSQEKLNQ